MLSIFVVLVILAILSLIAVARILWIIYRNKQHVSDDFLHQMMRNDLSEKVKPRVINHLGQCLQCRNRLNELNGFDPHPF